MTLDLFEEKEFVFQYLLITAPKEWLQFLHFISNSTKFKPKQA